MVLIDRQSFLTMTIFTRLCYLAPLCLLGWVNIPPCNSGMLQSTKLLYSARDTLPQRLTLADSLMDDNNNVLMSSDPIDLNAWLAVAQKAIQLRWAYPERPAVQKFIIFRGKGKRPLVTYKIVSAEDLLTLPLNPNGGWRAYSFMDRNIQKNKVYHYQVVARFEGGGTSPVSVVRTVRN